MMPPFAASLFGLSTGDWTTIGTGVVSIYLLWQQNQIFRRQNEIFASQVGHAAIPSKTPPRIRFERYWPTVIMVALILTTGYDYYDRHANRAPMSAWIIPSILVAAVLVAGVLNFLMQRHQVREIEAKIPSILVNGVPVAGPAKVAADKASQQVSEKNESQLRLYPRNVFTVQRVVAEPPSTFPSVVYKDKIRVILTNHLDREVEVWTPLWQSPDVHPQYPFGSLLRLEGPKGWKFDDWKEEARCFTLPVGVTFSCWIGLLPPVGKSIERRVQTQTRVGTAIFPVKIDGKLYEVPVEL